MTIATQYERYMLDLINIERAKVGASALQLEKNLNTSADAHSAWMLEEDIFSHTGVDGSSATQRIRDADFNLSGSWRTAENIAVQSERGPDGIMDDVYDLHISLMNSPGHRANILNPDLDFIGIGIALGDFDFNSGTYSSVIVTQNFASTGGQVDLDIEDVTPAPAPVEPATPVESTSLPLEMEPAAPLEVEPTAPLAVVADPDPAPVVPVQIIPTPAPPTPAVPQAQATIAPQPQAPATQAPAAPQTQAPSPVATVTAEFGADFFAFLRNGDLSDSDLFASGPSNANVTTAQAVTNHVQSQFTAILEALELDQTPAQLDDLAV